MDRNLESVVVWVAVVMSLSARRAWIEMLNSITYANPLQVALRKESVDRNSDVHPTERVTGSRSPQGERG